MALASPGVLIKEVDFTATVQVADQNIGVVAIDAEKGPTDVVTYISSERELVEIFGGPNDNNYEAWFAANTIIQYGGVVAVIRPTGGAIDLGLNNANITAAGTSLTPLVISSKDQFQNLGSGQKQFLFAARTAGSDSNGISVAVVDHGADQRVTVTLEAGVTPVEGDYVKWVVGSNTYSGNVYRVVDPDTLEITLWDSTKRLAKTTPATALLDSTGAAYATVTAIESDDVYGSLEYAAGRRWISLAPQPGTSATVAAKGGKFDEFHIAVIDTAGNVSGTPGTVLETLSYVSKASDARSSEGGSTFWKKVIEDQSKYIYAGDDYIARLDSGDILTVSVSGTASSGSQTFTGITGTTSGTGTGGEFTVSKSNGTYTVTVTNDGTGYAEGDTITILGTSLGGATPTNDITLTVTNVTPELLLLEGQPGTAADPGASAANSVFKLFDYSDSSTNSWTLAQGADYDYSSPTNIEKVRNACIAAYDLVKDPETFGDIDFLVPGYITETAAVRLIDIAESRRDCMVVISPRRDDVINSESSTAKTDSIIGFFKTLPSSSFAIFDSGYKYLYDKYNDRYRYVPCAADVAGLCLSTTINSETWFSPAGYNRGNLRNAQKLAYSPRQAERDRLYVNRINPIVSFPGQGIVLFGDKTALASPSAFDRINVRRLFIELEKNIASFSKFQLFELNDELTRSGFKSAVEPYLRGVQGRRGIYDFLVVCDTSNNTPDVIDRNEFNAEIYIKPARSINFITITFIATRTGVSFNELIN